MPQQTHCSGVKLSDVATIPSKVNSLPKDMEIIFLLKTGHFVEIRFVNVILVKKNCFQNKGHQLILFGLNHTPLKFTTYPMSYSKEG